MQTFKANLQKLSKILKFEFFLEIEILPDLTHENQLAQFLRAHLFDLFLFLLSSKIKFSNKVSPTNLSLT